MKLTKDTFKVLSLADPTRGVLDYMIIIDFNPFEVVEQILNNQEKLDELKKHSLACHECKEKICDCILDSDGLEKAITTTIYCEKCGEKLWDLQGDDLKHNIEDAKKYQIIKSGLEEIIQSNTIHAYEVKSLIKELLEKIEK